MFRELFEVVAYGYDGEIFCPSCVGDRGERDECNPIFVANLDDMPSYPCAVCGVVID